MITLKVQKLIYRSSQKKNFLDTVVFDKKCLDNKSLGKIFILVETEDQSIESAEISQGVIEIIKNQYYKEKAETAERRLEKTLQKLNDILSELITLGKKKWVNSINVLVAVIHKDQIYFSKTGKAYVLLIRGKENISITEDSSPYLNYPVKIFKHILSGRIEHQDFLILGNATLFNYFSDYKLSLITKRQKRIKEKKESLLKIIQEEQIPKNIIALLISVKKQKVETLNEIKRIEFQTESEVTQAVKRRLQAKIKKKFPFSIFYSFFNLLIKVLYYIQKKILNKILLQTALPFIKKSLLYLSKYLRKKIKKTFNKNKTYEKYYSVKLQNKLYKFDKIYDYLKKIQNKISALYLFLFSKKKLVFISLSVITFVFASTLFIFKKENQQNNQESSSNMDSDIVNLLTQAKEKKEQAENALIFNDENQAKNLLSEAQNLTRQVLGEKIENIEAQTLNKEIKTQIEKIYKLEKRDNLSVVYNLLILKENIDIQQIIPFGEDMYFYTNMDKNLIKLNLKNKEAKIISPNFSDIKNLKEGTNIGKEILAFLSEDKHIFTYNPLNNKLEKSADITLEGEFTKIKGFDAKLFLADKTKNQIFKSLKTMSGFSQPLEWLIDPLEVSEIKELAIDGSIYFLKTNGIVEKYFKGKKIDFQLDQIDFDLKNTDKIFTETDYQNLYLSSKSAKRIIIFNKNGKLVKQLLLENLESLDDFWVDPEEKTIFILSNNKVYETNLP